MDSAHENNQKDSYKHMSHSALFSIYSEFLLTLIKDVQNDLLTSQHKLEDVSPLIVLLSPFFQALFEYFKSLF